MLRVGDCPFCLQPFDTAGECACVYPPIQFAQMAEKEKASDRALLRRDMEEARSAYVCNLERKLFRLRAERDRLRALLREWLSDADFHPEDQWAKDVRTGLTLPDRTRAALEGAALEG